MILCEQLYEYKSASEEKENEKIYHLTQVSE